MLFNNNILCLLSLMAFSYSVTHADVIIRSRFVGIFLIDIHREIVWRLFNRRC